MLFKTVCDEYHLIPEENYTVPPEAEGLASKKEEAPEAKSLLLKQAKEAKVASEEGEDKTTLSTGATTRRHKQTPSIGLSFTTIQEGDEDDRDPESPTKEERETLPSSEERMSSSGPTSEEPALAKVSQPPEKDEPIPATAESAAQSTKEMSKEQGATEVEESKPEQEDGEKRPATAVSDKKQPSMENAATMIKTEELEKAPEEQ